MVEKGVGHILYTVDADTVALVSVFKDGFRIRNGQSCTVILLFQGRDGFDRFSDDDNGKRGRCFF